MIYGGLQYDNGEMAKLAAEYNLPVIAMHNQNGTEYSEDIILVYRKFFERASEISDRYGISEEII